MSSNLILVPQKPLSREHHNHKPATRSHWQQPRLQDVVVEVVVLADVHVPHRNVDFCAVSVVSGPRCLFNEGDLTGSADVVQVETDLVEYARGEGGHVGEETDEGGCEEVL
jgi:hypothetical protein